MRCGDGADVPKGCAGCRKAAKALGRRRVPRPAFVRATRFHKALVPIFDARLRARALCADHYEASGCGFETVTIAFQGEIEHGDSAGNGGVIKPGDVQWMTAGRGIIHEEFHSTEWSKTGGVVEMVQLWVNLPKLHKMVAPRYQGILNESIPKVSLGIKDGGSYVRVIAGEFGGEIGPASTWSAINLWDIEIKGKVRKVNVHILCCKSIGTINFWLEIMVCNH